jgi:hypothetical protein
MPQEWYIRTHTCIGVMSIDCYWPENTEMGYGLSRLHSVVWEPGENSHVVNHVDGV